jgi:glycosyltransferase involved in cell wall biosynthesis
MGRHGTGPARLVNHGTVVVVIPTYNRRALVVQSVKSVLEQTYGDVRCIVVDNGSTDGTGEAVTAFGDPRVSLVTLGTPCGAAAARNAGLEAAGSAPWVAFLDNDDIWAPAKLEHQLAALAANPEASWSATACVHVGPDLHVRWAARLRQEALLPAEGTVVASSDMISLLTEDQHVPAGSSSALASLDLVLAAGGFNLDVPGCEDWDLWLRLAKRSPLLYVDLPLVAYRVWDGQTSTDVRAQVRSATVLRARHFPDSGPPSRSYRARWEQDAARRHVAGRRRGRAAARYVRAAWTGRNPGQLAYAVAAVAAPSLTERRLQRIERTRSLPAGWEEMVEPWLAGWR